ncbi:MAG TPA: tRNA (N(6)-L-threonylcarbamoyladenosine(37)-C(2))-methylthiotransferase MtaB [Dehalococcoidia bacterium]|nr:tRNA (N(6)-L-threonylcarbamoyladenosine(37)-C(2))-methylthiotransferase MtaB [Dehalococcoidia bacterium]
MSDSARPATAAILTLGCKLNIADSEALARRLRDAGWSVVDRLGNVDAVVVNTCSVTGMADQKSRHLVRLARRQAPNATVALTGCLLETAAPEAIDLLNAGLVYRQVDQVALADELIRLHPVQTPVSVSRGLKTRAFISAQEGCNDVCAFCIIPKTRGRERSKTVEAVVAEAQAGEGEGVQEIVITGTQLGAYGREFGYRSPYRLIKGLLQETSVPRIRMSSVQPQDLSGELIDLWQDARLCRHFHLALQSGSQATLQRMRRRYTQDEYRRAVEHLRGAIPGVAITTDVIVGFPGETGAEFEESYQFCREMAFAGIHVFPYSQRSGTLAYKMASQLPEPAKKERVHRLIDLATEMSAAYRGRDVGREVEVLWENQREGMWEGLTDTYIRVRASSGADLKNRITTARITGLADDGLSGEVTP